MKIHDKLDEIVAFIESARGLPMSSSVVVNKAELARLLDELRGLFPDDLLEAQAVLERREHILTEAVANAERLLTAAEEEKQRLVADEEVLRQARIEAGTVLQSARAESEHMAREIDGYVDAKLAHLEVSITKLLDTVRQGRDHLAEPGLYNDLAAPDEPEAPAPAALPPSYERPELGDRPAPGGYETYDVPPSGYRVEPDQPVSHEVGPPSQEPDQLTDDVWLTPVTPRSAEFPVDVAGDEGELAEPDEVVEFELESVEAEVDSSEPAEPVEAEPVEAQPVELDEAGSNDQPEPADELAKDDKPGADEPADEPGADVEPAPEAEAEPDETGGHNGQPVEARPSKRR